MRESLFIGVCLLRSNGGDMGNDSMNIQQKTTIMQHEGLTLLLIRHAEVQGNIEQRYIGRTDQPLCPQGELTARALYERGLPKPDALYVSPYIRCRRTAELLFPHMQKQVVQELRECDFGEFEGKTAAELSGDLRYAAWLDSGCAGDIPGGESPAEFMSRAADALCGIIARSGPGETVAVVTHGGCIMAMLTLLALPRREFYDWRIRNCAPVICRCTGGHLSVEGGV